MGRGLSQTTIINSSNNNSSRPCRLFSVLSLQESSHTPSMSPTNTPTEQPVALVLFSRPKRKSESFLIHQKAQIDHSVPQWNRHSHSRTFLHSLHYIAHLYNSFPLSTPTLPPIPHIPHLIERSAPRPPHPQRQRQLHPRGSAAISAQQIALLPLAFRRTPRTEAPALEPRHILPTYVPPFPRFYPRRIGRRTAIFACSAGADSRLSRGNAAGARAASESAGKAPGRTRRLPRI